MTKRFDRTDGGEKLHLQSLGAIAHFDYNQPARYSYEQSIQVIKQLELPRSDLEQQVLRAYFNVMGRNCDDHVKNIAFLMNRTGTWRISPAFDISFAWNPSGEWTSRHQMSINGKRDDFSKEDLLSLAGNAGIKKNKATELLEQVRTAILRWPEFADIAEISHASMKKIQSVQILAI